ncbi:hypothetical protein [Ammonifex degensii]|nr:hypothetical protein [Ammonifex degensii]
MSHEVPPRVDGVSPRWVRAWRVATSPLNAKLWKEVISMRSLFLWPVLAFAPCMLRRCPPPAANHAVVGREAKRWWVVTYLGSPVVGFESIQDAAEFAEELRLETGTPAVGIHELSAFEDWELDADHLLLIPFEGCPCLRVDGGEILPVCRVLREEEEQRRARRQPQSCQEA